jgi:pimeloyl-ACP methyl ester carboxylesterase
VRRKVKQPLLILHGDHDETVSVERAYELKSWQPAAELVVLPGVTHNFGGSHPWQQETLPAEAQQTAYITVDFLRRVL